MKSSTLVDRVGAVEWPTIGLILLCYSTFLMATLFADVIGTLPAILIVILSVTLHSSLQHEVVHGHPTRIQRLNESLIVPAIGVFLPYGRFRDVHIRHHENPEIAEPFEDPESRYLDPAQWAKLSATEQVLRMFNNTLLGRLTIGPAIGLWDFYREELQSLAGPERATILKAYAWHIPALGGVLLYLAFFATLPLWAYLIACYFGLSVLLIRTFLEHQAHERHGARTVIIEDRGPLAFLFLNNNLHAVHHARPSVAWYQLPAVYRARRAAYLRHNEHYVYRSYWEVIRAHFFTAKEPVPYPLPASKKSRPTGSAASMSAERQRSVPIGHLEPQFGAEDR